VLIKALFHEKKDLFYSSVHIQNGVRAKETGSGDLAAGMNPLRAKQDERDASACTPETSGLKCGAQGSNGSA